MAKIHSARDTVRLAKRCQRCHGWLVSPASVNVLLGPVCLERTRAERRAALANTQFVLFDLDRAAS